MEDHETDTKLEEMQNQLLEGKMGAIDKPKPFVDLTLDVEVISSSPDVDRTFVGAKQVGRKASSRLKRRILLNPLLLPLFLLSETRLKPLLILELGSYLLMRLVP